jgi:lipoprotein-releasing system ATP-binding protein
MNLFFRAVMEPMIAVEDVWKSFDRGRIEVLKGIQLRVNAGEIVALCGTSGCGKSTLLNVIGGLEMAERGRVEIAGRERKGEKERLALLRREVGFIFQLHQLVPGLTLEENCLIPALATRMSRGKARARVRELAERTGISSRLDRRVRELSGGERQRGALVRALINDPPVLLADEPTGALDESNRERVFDLLLELARSAGKTLLIATHDLDLASRCDRVVRMRDGQIVSP